MNKTVTVFCIFLSLLLMNGCKQEKVRDSPNDSSIVTLNLHFAGFTKSKSGAT